MSKTATSPGDWVHVRTHKYRNPHATSFCVSKSDVFPPCHATLQEQPSSLSTVGSDATCSLIFFRAALVRICFTHLQNQLRHTGQKISIRR